MEDYRIDLEKLNECHDGDYVFDPGCIEQYGPKPIEINDPSWLVYGGGTVLMNAILIFFIFKLVMDIKKQPKKLSKKKRNKKRDDNFKAIIVLLVIMGVLNGLLINFVYFMKECDFLSCADSIYAGWEPIIASMMIALLAGLLLKNILYK